MIVGTAGHIDHGKPKASDEPVIGFVDVPGHKRFVHNMLAGACGIDLVLLVQKDKFGLFGNAA
jgi:selenocysteine-specific translation elongation factor